MIRSREFDFGIGKDAEQRKAEFEKQNANTQEYVDKKVSQWEEKYARAVLEGAMPDIKDIVERIDFQTLHEILSEYMSRSGVDPASFNLLEKSDIQPGDLVKISNSHAHGAYEFLTNKVFVNLKKFKSETEQFSIALHIIIHELTHAASASLYRNYGDSSEDIIKSGYAQQKLVKPSSKVEYSTFDEAVTEKVAQEVMEIYAQRIGITEKLQQFKLLQSKEKKFSAYGPQVEFLENMINKIAIACEVPAGTVWDAIKKGKFGNNELDDLQVQEVLTEIFNAKFVDRLKEGRLEDMVESKILRIRMKINRVLGINLA